MNKNSFTEFRIGTVFNSTKIRKPVKLCHEKIKVSYPSRLEAMALDPSKITDKNNLVYKAGQIDFCINILKYITVEIDFKSQDITLSERTPRKSLVNHAALLMKKALDLKEGLKIDVDDSIDLRHCGLGSSSSLIAGTAATINELYGNPIDALDLVKYCAQNHGEEIDGDDENLVPVQCIGGSGVCGHFEGGLIILSGEATPIFTHNILDEQSVVIGIPNDYTYPDSKKQFDSELQNLDGFRKSGTEFGPMIAYRLVHEVMPELKNNNLKACKDLIFDYRWNMDSIKNCSYSYPRMIEIAEKLRILKDDDDVSIISLSSVGPSFFALTQNPKKIIDLFKSLDMTTYETTICNDKYKVKVIR